jgi:hypothetical protein
MHTSTEFRHFHISTFSNFHILPFRSIPSNYFFEYATADGELPSFIYPGCRSFVALPRATIMAATTRLDFSRIIIVVEEDRGSCRSVFFPVSSFPRFIFHHSSLRHFFVIHHPPRPSGTPPGRGMRQDQHLGTWMIQSPEFRHFHISTFPNFHIHRSCLQSPLIFTFSNFPIFTFAPSVRSHPISFLNTLPRTVNSRHSFTRRVAPSSLYPGLP